MPLADYPFLNLLGTMLIFFLWVMWFWLLITIWSDIFRRQDLSGLGKTGWLIFTIVLPFLGVFIYLITQNEAMAKRNLERARAQQERMDQYVRETAGAGGAAAEIERAKGLLDSGAINQEEFERIKQGALS